MEIREGVNDFSIIKSGRLNKTWLMLGPISFVNASCDANIEYSRKGFSIQAVVKRDIVVGEELSVFYDKHFLENSMSTAYVHSLKSMETRSRRFPNRRGESR